MKNVFNVSLRFMVDEYIELRPYLPSSDTFWGRCPESGLEGGVVVNEAEGSIRLLSTSEVFIGYSGWRHFRNRFKKRPPIENLDLKNQKISELNESFKVIFHQAHLNLKDLISVNQMHEVSNRISLVGDVRFSFNILERHRLYHPDSDNILCSFTHYSELEFEEDDLKMYSGLCWPLHDLLVLRHVRAQDLLSVRDVSLEYKLRHHSEFLF